MELADQKTSRRSVFKYVLGFFGIVGLIIVVCVLTFFYLNQPPSGVSYPISLTVEPGADAQSVAAELLSVGAIRSDTFFTIVLELFFDPTDIKASTYVIDGPLSTYQFAEQLIEGDFGNDLIRFTHIEGESVNKLADSAAQLETIDRDVFIAAALPYEGRLFPDTYFIRNDFSEVELVTLLRESFTEAIAPLESAINDSNLSLDQILILASIVEREANTPTSMKYVAGVFQNRIAVGMPLQADASIEYILDKPLNELTASDLEIDSPYNTYVNPGLPPTPIGNPGLQAIEAILFPIESEYFFYITDDSGTFHYAETYEQHLRNIDRYLR